MKLLIALMSFSGLMLVGCSDPQQPSSLAAAGEPAAATGAPLASESDRALAASPSWLQGAQESDRLACYVDVVEGAKRTAAGWDLAAKSARLSGWSVDSRNQQQPPALLVLQGEQGQFVFKAVRSQRDDVTNAEQFKALAPVLPGVAVSLFLDGVPAGAYRASLVVGEGESAERCDLGASNQLLVH